MIYGILNLPWWGYIIALLVLTHITILAVTLYLHRCQAHRGIDMNPYLGHFFRFWLWLTTGMITKEWVAIHRKHHARCETEEDPHSPQFFGIKKLLLEGAELYKAASKDKQSIEKFGFGTPNDWIERKLYSPYNSIGIGIMLIIDLLLFGVWGITLWALQMMWIPFFAAGVVNGLGHYMGYRNFECPDASTNICPWGLFLGGEELHNNHHTFGSSAKFSVKWWEVDIGWGYIQLFKCLGLVKIRRVFPKLIVNSNKKHIDIETLKALIANRFQVMARYSQDVIKPILEDEMHKAERAGHALLKRAKGLIYRNRTLIDDDGKKRLRTILEDRVNLQKVYHFREKLQDIWDKTATNHKELVEALQEWCKQAEATGIEALKDFARRLSGYTLPAHTN